MVEDLHIRGMVKNCKLARSIQDAGWGNFLTTLDDKCHWQGKTVIRIRGFEPSSKRCHCCEHKRESLPLSERSWVCPVCHTPHDRDINAACNIRDMGLADALV